VSNELSACLCAVWVCAKQSSLAEVKALKSVEYFAERHGFFTNFHSRVMKCKLGEYAGKYSHAMPSVSAPDCPRAQRWERALSKTRGMGTCQPRAPSFLHNGQTLSALMSVQLVTVITACVLAWSAPSPGKRCRPLGALLQHRAQPQSYPRTAPQTKGAASTKQTARFPACASAKRGANVFLIRFLHIGVAFGWQEAALATGEPEVSEQQADLRGTASDAREGFEPRDRCVAGLGRRLPHRRCKSVPIGASCALGAMEGEVFECFHTACVIQPQIRSQGMGRKSTQLGHLVVWHAWALEPQGVHPLLHTRMRMMGAFVVPRLFVCLTACKLEHPGVILFVRRSMVMSHHR